MNDAVVMPCSIELRATWLVMLPIWLSELMPDSTEFLVIDDCIAPIDDDIETPCSSLEYDTAPLDIVDSMLPIADTDETPCSNELRFTFDVMPPTCIVADMPFNVEFLATVDCAEPTAEVTEMPFSTDALDTVEII